VENARVSPKDIKIMKDRLIQELIKLTALETRYVGVHSSPYFRRMASIIWVLIYKQLINIRLTLPEIVAISKLNEIQQKKSIYTLLLLCDIKMERSGFEAWLEEQELREQALREEA
jgi:hypothetical protein